MILDTPRSRRSPFAFAMALSTALAAALMGALASLQSAHASPEIADAPSWQTYQGPDGASVVFGDGGYNPPFAASCRPNEGGGQPSVALSPDTHGPDGASGGFTVRVDGERWRVPARYTEGGRTLAAELPVNDPLWSALRRGAAASVAIEGGSAQPVALKGSGRAIGAFLQACRAFGAHDTAAASQPLAVAPTGSTGAGSGGGGGGGADAPGIFYLEGQRVDCNRPFGAIATFCDEKMHGGLPDPRTPLARRVRGFEPEGEGMSGPDGVMVALGGRWRLVNEPASGIAIDPWGPNGPIYASIHEGRVYPSQPVGFRAQCDGRVRDDALGYLAVGTDGPPCYTVEQLTETSLVLASVGAGLNVDRYERVSYEAGLDAAPDAVSATPEPRAVPLEPARAPGQRVELGVAGRSFGGRARGAPGLDGAVIGSLPEGTLVTLVANTGVTMDGADWFEIEVDGRSYGYQWGGILCAEGMDLPGTQRCPR